MTSMVLRGVVIVPAVTHAIDYKTVFPDEERKGRVSRWECFRLQVESGFRLVTKAPQAIVQRWELVSTLSQKELMSELSSLTEVQSWHLHHLLFPRDIHGVLQPSVFRGIRKGMVMMRVSGDSDALPLVDVSLPKHGDSAKAPFILKLPKGQSEFYAGLSVFSLIATT